MNLLLRFFRTGGWVVLLLHGVVASVQAQSGVTAAPFLTISPDARLSGMGEAGTGVAGTPAAAVWNSAALAFRYSPEQNRSTAWATYSNYLAQAAGAIHYAAGGYTQNLSMIDGVVSGHVTYLSLGQLEQRDDARQLVSQYSNYDLEVGVSYSTMLAGNLAAGIQGKYILSGRGVDGGASQRGTGATVAFDVGALWRTDTVQLLLGKGRIGVGASLQNVGPKLSYLTADAAEPLPTTFRFGGSADIEFDDDLGLLLAADISKLLVNRESGIPDPVPVSLVTGWNNGGLGFGFGLEMALRKRFAFRAGLNSRPGVADQSDSFGTLGAGVWVGPVVLDFSYLLPLQSNHPLANTMRFSVSGDL